MSLGFTKSKVDPNVYSKVEDGMQVILFLYVDDLFLTGDEELIADSKRKLAAEFEMKDLGPLHYFLGLEVWQKPGEIILSQGKYVVEIFEKIRDDGLRIHDYTDDNGFILVILHLRELMPPYTGR